MDAITIEFYYPTLGDTIQSYIEKY